MGDHRARLVAGARTIGVVTGVLAVAFGCWWWLLAAVLLIRPVLDLKGYCEGGTLCTPPDPEWWAISQFVVAIAGIGILAVGSGMLLGASAGSGRRTRGLRGLLLGAGLFIAWMVLFVARP